MDHMETASLRHSAPARALLVLAAVWLWAGVSGFTPVGARLEQVAKAPSNAAPAPPPLPERLSGTGLFLPGTRDVDPAHLAYSPQYSLWSDGAGKRRWMSLPEGGVIDGSDPDSWEFPAGTRFWKEFSFGARVETRYLERLPDGAYRYATYVWDPVLDDGVLAPESGVRGVRELGGGVRHDVPSDGECRACHEGRPSPVLGVGALQLSSDRDPLSPHTEPLPKGAVDLRELVRRRLIAGLPASVVSKPPRIAGSPRERAAAGYLFGNCSGCHNARGPLAFVGLDFDQPVMDLRASRARESVERRRSAFTLPGESESLRVVPGRPEASAVWFRMQATEPASRMPPIGTKLVDPEALELVRSWISHDF